MAFSLYVSGSVAFDRGGSRSRGIKQGTRYDQEN